MPEEYRDRIQCDSCGAINSSRNKNCYNCGQPLRITGGSIIRTPIIRRTPRPSAPGATGAGGSTPDPNQIQCQNIGCRKIYDKNEHFCPVCGTPNPLAPPLKPGEVLCLNCRKIVKIKDAKDNNDKCPKCQNYISGLPTTTKLKESVGKRISGRLYEILIFVLAGIFVIFGLPFFGLPSLPLLGGALMFLVPLYIYLPDEHEVLASIREGEDHLSTTGGLSLFFKGIIKMITFVATVVQFIIVPISMFIPLAISFIYYFDLPRDYKTSQPYRMLEAWLRLGVGVLIAIFFVMAFTGNVALSLAFMALAFFSTSFPYQKEETEPGIVKVELFAKRYGASMKAHGGFEFISFTLFLIFMGMGWFLSGGGGALGLSTTNIIFNSVWILSLIAGISAGPSGRPHVGILMIAIALFVFSFTYTGVIGQAVFGYWWPQIESFGSMVGETVSPLWSQATGGMSDAWMLLTNPAQYYNIQLQKQQASKSVVKSGGTTKSIELTKTDLFMSVTGILEPILDPLVGSYEIQNQGEFDANSIELKIWASWKDPISLNEICTGRFTKFECSSPGSALESASGVCEIGTCSWTNTTYPNEIKLSTFVFEKNSWSLGGDDNLNVCNPSDCTDPNSTYNHSGQSVKINANITYDYNVNVSIPAEVIDWDVYLRLLQAREITLQELTSQYTGGPVKATLWSQKQPIRSGEVSLFIASIYNDGIGEIISVSNFKIKIPEELGAVEKVSSTFYGSGGVDDDGCTLNPNTVNGYREIDCNHTWADHPIKTGEFKRVSFLITPPENIPVDRMTRLITGLANYAYIKTKSQSITIATSYPH